MQRHTWLNTIVGILDSSFYLTDEELFFTSDIVRRLLEALNIPERGRPSELPVAVALEASTHLYSMQISGGRQLGAGRPGRVTNSHDTVVTLEAWRQALMTLITTSYDLDGLETLAVTKVLDDLLVALGVPGRAAAYMPDDVVRAHLDGA